MSTLLHYFHHNRQHNHSTKIRREDPYPQTKVIILSFNGVLLLLCLFTKSNNISSSPYHYTKTKTNRGELGFSYLHTISSVSWQISIINNYCTTRKPSNPDGPNSWIFSNPLNSLVIIHQSSIRIQFISVIS